MTLPEFREDIAIHVEDDGTDHYLVLHDIYGFADGPIMVHSDMLQVIEACNGRTTYEQLAEAAEVSIDGKEMMRLKAFVGRLSELGYLHDANFVELKRRVTNEFESSSLRQPIYVRESTELSLDSVETLLSTKTSTPHSIDTTPCAILVPHIDFRVAPEAYQPAIDVLRHSDTDVFVIVGTSHYWSETPVVTTTKDFVIGGQRIPTHKECVRQIAESLGDLNASSDIAHKPEHSIEMHVALLRIARADRPFTIIPILIAGGADTDEQVRTLRTVADTVKGAVQMHCPTALWMISGDLAHVGLKFGDETPATHLEDAVRKADADILKSLETVDIPQYITNSTLPEFQQRICGLGPTAVVLEALQPASGKVLHYGLWNEAETGSAVSYATVQFENVPFAALRVTRPM
jgi:MEMO1 family protein